MSRKSVTLSYNLQCYEEPPTSASILPRPPLELAGVAVFAIAFPMLSASPVLLLLKSITPPTIAPMASAMGRAGERAPEAVEVVGLVVLDARRCLMEGMGQLVACVL